MPIPYMDIIAEQKTVVNRFIKFTLKKFMLVWHKLFYFVKRRENMSGSTIYALKPFVEEDEQALFLSILYHDIRGGNAIRMLLGEGGETPYVRHFANKDYNKIKYMSTNYNAYASLNTFKSYKRVADEVYNHSGIFIDLDGHDFKSTEAMDAAIDRTWEKLQKAFEDGEITAPTMVTHTGRGLGLFYILESSIANQPKAQKSIKYLDDVRAALTAKYKHLLSGRGYLEVDTAVKDAARVCRMPGTINKKINRTCRLIHVSYKKSGEVEYCDLNRLAKENHLFDEINKIKREIASKKIISLDAYRMPFLTIRLQKLEMLQELRKFKCTGVREYMIFIYYNAAKQIYGADQAVLAVKEFNKKFSEPLPESELTHAFTVTDRNMPPTGDYEGFYKLPDKWVVEVLDVTDEENKQCHFGASKRQIERENTKKENRSRREERDKTIAEYIVANPKETYPSIAAQFGVSESKIYLICKQFGISRYNGRNEAVEKAAETVAEPVKAAEITKVQNLKNLSKSPLGVPFEGLRGPSSDAFPLEMGVSVECVHRDIVESRQDGLVQAYADLYGSVTKRRKKSRQMPGQMGFRIGPDGEVEYYVIA